LQEVDISKSNDPVLRDIEKAAKDNGLRLRLWIPGSDTASADTKKDPNRANVFIASSPSGGFRVANYFEYR
jgi:hypothetical protein